MHVCMKQMFFIRMYLRAVSFPLSVLHAASTVGESSRGQPWRGLLAACQVKKVHVSI